jgi:hypothetical protein
MCTVTYIPHQEHIFITANRDESPGRQSTGLYTLKLSDQHDIHFPLDEASRGSWIALAETGRAVCLLNGALEPFIPLPSYRQSRGQVVVDAAASDDVDNFVHDYPLFGIAPFTLLQYAQGTLTELLWDGAHRTVTMLDPAQPRIWSSATLYPPDVRKWRSDFFNSWIQSTETIDRESIIGFHQQKRGDGQNDFIMNRNEIVKTLSVTSIQLGTSSGSILHLDLDRHHGEEIRIANGR